MDGLNGTGVLVPGTRECVSDPFPRDLDVYYDFNPQGLKGTVGVGALTKSGQNIQKGFPPFLNQKRYVDESSLLPMAFEVRTSLQSTTTRVFGRLLAAVARSSRKRSHRCIDPVNRIQSSP